jgi:tetratricopeptide (TPR) repeat protein
LIAARQFQAAIPFLEQSLQLEDSFFANKWMGQTLISIKRVDEGIPYLEKAKQIDATDVQVLSNLARTYFMVGNKEMAILILEELKAINPDHPYLLSVRSN